MIDANHFEYNDIEYEQNEDNDNNESYSINFDYIQIVEQFEATLLQKYKKNMNDFSWEIIFLSLYTCQFQVELTSNILVQLESLILNAKTPCKYLFKGGCKRSDCFYEHDLTTIPCRYFVLSNSQGGCLWYNHQIYAYENGFPPDDSIVPCPYYHGIPIQLLSIITNLLPSYSNNSETTQSMETLSINEDNFPNLTTKSSSKPAMDLNPNPISTIIQEKPLVKGSKIKLGAQPYLKEKQQTLPPSHTNPNHSKLSNGKESTKKMNSSFGKELQNTIFKDNSSIRSNPITLSLGTQILPNDWVESGTIPSWTISLWYLIETLIGSTVSKDYHYYRAEARQYAIYRNKLFEEATRAYRGGSKALAKNLSEKGRTANNSMKQCHMEAAKIIFCKRNSNHSIIHQRQIDFHGLHVQEVEECLEILFPKLNEYQLYPMTLVTGSGHHSDGPQKGISRLLPKVLEICQRESKAKYKIIKDNNGYESGVMLYL